MAIAYRWDAAALAYRDAKSGQRIPDADVRDAVSQVSQAASDHMAALSERLKAGEITQAAWRDGMSGEIKLANLALGMAGSGGRASLTQSARFDLSQVIRDQYAFLDGFARQVANDASGLAGKIANRARMYAASARLAFEHARDRLAIAGGFDEEKNVMGAAERHCHECPALSALGWVAAGTLPGVGRRLCRARCKCVIARRRSPKAQGVAA